MSKLKYIIGIIFILFGLVFNESNLRNYFSTYAIMGLDRRIPILLIDFIFIVLGIIILLIKSDLLTFEKITKYYKVSAITVLSMLLLFIFANVFVYSISIIKDIIVYKNQIFSIYSEPFTSLYSNLNRKQVDDLLRETWSRPYVYEPFTQFKERPYKGKYVNVNEHGFRPVKDQGPWPPVLDNYNIFLFGGSTTFNYGLSDDQTTAEYLQRYFSDAKLNKKVFIYNFGRGNYYSTQERILFEKLLTAGLSPNLAIFIDGLNDFYYINDEPQYTEKIRDFVDNGGNLLNKIPFVKAVKSFKMIFTNGSKSVFKNENYNDQVIITKVINRYLLNKKLIEAVSSHFAVKTLFIWQPVPTYKYDLKYHKPARCGFGKFTYSKYGYPRMAEYIKKVSLGNNFLWLADMQKNLKQPLYVDIDHYSGEMSEKIAKRIYDYLINDIMKDKL
ncbi:MAG: SGNH/GDSL hydrolase family protein [Candidatus Melainabacteria bacterium]|nr:SGNH/GDSL hydrolase family protein [Candidatus Melainabacteria bacterium]